MKAFIKRMVSLLLCMVFLLALMPSVSAAGTTTVYCNAPDTWSKCYVYWQGSSISNPYWPGKEMKKDANGIWYYEIPSGVDTILFNNGDTISANLNVPDDDKVQYNYVDREWVAYGTACKEVITLYVDAKSAGLSNSVNAYMWDCASANTWPGTAMTQVSDNVYAIEVYSDTSNIIFNDGVNQTADLKVPGDGRNLWNGTAWTSYPPENAYQGSVKITADTLGLAENQYSSGTAAVDEIAVEWTHLGNYGEGIQMKDGDDISSMVWNTEALPGGITKIVLTYSPTQEAWETENMFVRFGNEAKGSDYSTTLITVEGYSVFTIFPGAIDYEYFYLEWFHSWTSYWDSIEVFYRADGHSHTYQADVTAPTCLEQGYTIYSCTVCGSSYCDDYTAATGHSFGEWVIDSYPTCEDKGYLYRKCMNCNFREEGVAATVGHQFVDGVCATCGTHEGPAKPEIAMSYPSLSFEDEIFYNVYFTVDDTSDVVEMGLITFHEKLTDGTMADAVDVIPGYLNSGSTYMVQSKGIPAKNLGDALYFKVYAKLSDGSYAYSDVAGYNAVAYAKTVLNDTKSSAEAKALVVAMLNYGAAAQEYFGYKTDALMNAFLSAADKALVAEYDSGMVADVVKADPSKAGQFVMNGGYSNSYPTVSFEGAFSINYYFTPDGAVDSAPVMYYWDAETYNNAAVLSTWNATGVISMTQDGSDWGAAIDGIAAKNIDETVYVAGFYTSEGVAYPTGVIAYSLGQYCKTIAANGEAFGAATAVYGYYAKAYFA